MEAKQTIRASIIVVNYNSWPDIQRCLESLIRVNYKNDEIIVVDNGSSDGSVERIASLFPQVVLLQNNRNLGFGGANNLGAQIARGRYLAFLNPDTEVAPDWLDALIDELEREPEVGLVTSKILLLGDRERINTCGNDVHLTGLTLCRGTGRPATEMSANEDVSAVSGAAFAIRATSFHALEGFDEVFFLYMEDTDLSLRAALAGYRIRCVPESVVYHDYTLRFGPAKTYFQERNRYMMLLKTMRWPTLILLIPALLLAEIITWGFVLLRDRPHWTNKFRAYGYVVRHWSSLMARRKQTQALRTVPDRQLMARMHFRLDFEQADGGIAAKGAHLIFDPLFYLWQRLMLGVVRW